MKKVKIKTLEQKSKDLTENAMSLEYLIKHLQLDHVISNLGKPKEFENSVTEEMSKGEIYNTISQGERVNNDNHEEEEKIEKNDSNQCNEEGENIENNNYFEDMHKINLDNSHEFQEKLNDLRKEEDDH